MARFALGMKVAIAKVMACTVMSVLKEPRCCATWCNTDNEWLSYHYGCSMIICTAHKVQLVQEVHSTNCTHRIMTLENYLSSVLCIWQLLVAVV